jgi:four helix bundle protein
VEDALEMVKEREKSRTFWDLRVWKLSIDFVKEIYKLTNKFPNSEVYGLTSQLRRAAVSIPSNIAEGQGRNSIREFKQFLSVAVGSLAELETQLIIAQEIEYITNDELKPLLVCLDDIRKMVKSLAMTLK